MSRRRSNIPMDPRRFLRLATDITTNPKVNDVEHPAFAKAYVYGLAIAAQNMSDGHIKPSTVLRQANVTQWQVELGGQLMSVEQAMYRQEIWHPRGHDCERCPQPKPGYAYIHDFLLHQPSKADWEEFHDAKVRAGQAGGRARWGTKDDNTSTKAPPQAPATAGGMADAMADATAALSREQPPAPKKSAPARRRTRLTEDFRVDLSMRAWAAREVPGVDVVEQTKTFMAHYLGLGDPRDDWEQVWKAWMLRARQSRPSHAVARYQEPTDAAARLRAQEQARRGQ